MRHPRTPDHHVYHHKAGKKRLTDRQARLKSNWEEYGADNTQGLVYFIQAVDGGPIKIGCSEWLAQRLWQLQIGNPRELVVRRAIAVDVEILRISEASYHATFKHLWIRGEWFQAAPELAEVADAISDM